MFLFMIAIVQSITVISLRQFFLRKMKPNFADLDGDGYYETIGYDYIRPTSVEEGNFWAREGGEVLVIYRYKNGFKRIKGRSFEKYYMEHAHNLLEKNYPAWIDKLKNTKTDSFDSQLKRETVYRIIAAWLATVESTQNPELIKAAFKKMRELPYPLEEEKQEIVKKLIEYGYTGLKID